MSQPGYSNEAVQTPQPQSTPGTPTTPITDDGKRKGNGGKVARRALLAAAGVGVCVAGVELAPAAMNKVGEYTQAQVQNAFQAGVNEGRQALLNELAQIEGITIDGAISVAELTRLAVRFIVLPVAQLNATITGDVLGVIDSGLLTAKDNLSKINVHIGALDAMEGVVASWRKNVVQLPIALSAYANADIDSAESYLKGLKQKIQDEQSQNNK